jgi:HK97 family phage major capsid protein
MKYPILLGGVDVFARNRAIYGNSRMDATVVRTGSRLEQIRTRQAEIAQALGDLEIVDAPSEDEVLRTDALIQEAEELIEEAEPLQSRQDRITEVRERMAQDRAHGEEGSDRIRQMSGSAGPEFRTRVDPWADQENVRSGLIAPADLRSRADAAIEQFSKRGDFYSLEDNAAEEVTRKLHKLGDKFGSAFSRMILDTGRPEYLRAFEQYLNDPTGYSSRAALSLTSANGGYLVPFTLDPTIILTNNGVANPFRDNATIKTTTTNDWNGVTSAGVTAEWTAEGIEAADASPTVGPLKVTPQKADAYLFGSYEVLGDSDFASQLPMLLADAKSRLEENAFAVGTGTLQPWGVITRGTLSTQAAGSLTIWNTGGAPVLPYVMALIGVMPARWRGPNSRPVFLASLPVINQLRTIPKFALSTESIVNDNGPVPTIMGVPLLESTSMVGNPAVNLSKVLAYVDMRQYYIVDRVGMSVVYDNLVLGANRRPTGQGAWYAFWRTGADISVATADRVLQVIT